MTSLVQPYQGIDFHNGSGMAGAFGTRDERARQAYQRGYDEGAANAAAQAQARLATAIETLTETLLDARAEAERRWTMLERDAADFAVIVARKVSAGLVGPEALVKEAMRAALAAAAGAPRLAVTVHPALAECLTAHMADITQYTEQSATIAIEVDAALGQGDCAIVWAGGAIHRDDAALDQQIAAMIARSFPSSAAHEEPVP